MEEDDKGCPIIRMGVSGWAFLLVPAYPGCPGPKAVKRLCVRACVRACVHTMAVCLSVCLSQANIIWKGWTDLAHFSTEATFALSYTVLEGNSGIPRKNGTSLWHCSQNSLKFCYATSTTASVVSLVWPAIINSLSHWASTWSST